MPGAKLPVPCPRSASPRALGHSAAASGEQAARGNRRGDSASRVAPVISRPCRLANKSNLSGGETRTAWNRGSMAALAGPCVSRYEYEEQKHWDHHNKRDHPNVMENSSRSSHGTSTGSCVAHLPLKRGVPLPSLLPKPAGGLGLRGNTLRAASENPHQLSLLFGAAKAKSLPRSQIEARLRPHVILYKHDRILESLGL